MNSQKKTENFTSGKEIQELTNVLDALDAFYDQKFSPATKLFHYSQFKKGQ